MPNFYRADLSSLAFNTELNTLLEYATATAPEPNVRQYLGASSIGSMCLRRIQYDWMCDASHPLRIRDIFRRGHIFEALSKAHLIAAGFRFADNAPKFTAYGGLFRGHCDGQIVAGPSVPGLKFPCLWEHKCLNAKSYRAIDRDGLLKAYPAYAAQVWIYQYCLELTQNPVLFTVINADTCDRLHFLFEFDPAQAQTWIDRAAMVIEATRLGELLPRVSGDPSDWRCKICGHRRRCWGHGICDRENE
jgi:hypothetical protein